MINPRKFITGTAAALALLATGVSGISSCTNSAPNLNAGNSAAAANSAANPAKDDVSQLLSIVRLPEVPEEAVWREEAVGKTNDRVPKPTDRKLIAVLKYDAETAAKLEAQIEKHKSPKPAEIGTENWFPEELVAQSQISGNEMLKGTAYGANDFFNMPYGSGLITRIENTNYFVLELYAS